MKPLVLVPTDVKPLDGFDWHATIDIYLKSTLRVADAQPLLLPSLGNETDLEAALAKVDGVLMTGSRSNVHPSHYDVEESEDYAPFDGGRDATTLPLIRAAIAAGKPLLAICRGHQELNVAMGGSLHTEIQRFDGRHDHRAPEHDDNDVRFQLAHHVTPTAGGKLAEIVGDTPIKVNSLHRQAIDRLGDGLAIEAKAEDGTIEAVSVRDAAGFTLSLQWHPEYWAESETVSQKIFHAFGSALRGL